MAVEARLAAERALARQKVETAIDDGDALAAPAKDKPAPTFANFDEALAALRENPNMLLVDAQAARDFMKMLEALGDEGTAKVLALLESEESADRIAAAQLLLQLGDPAAIKPLGEAVINDPDAEAAAWASQALIRLDGDGAKEALQNALANSPHEAVKVNSLWGLCRHEDPEGSARTLAYYEDAGNNADMRRALGLGALALNSASVMPVVDAVSSRESDSTGIMQRVIDSINQAQLPQILQEQFYSQLGLRTTSFNPLERFY